MRISQHAIPNAGLQQNVAFNITVFTRTLNYGGGGKNEKKYRISTRAKMNGKHVRVCAVWRIGTDFDRQQHINNISEDFNDKRAKTEMSSHKAENGKNETLLIQN